MGYLTEAFRKVFESSREIADPTDPVADGEEVLFVLEDPKLKHLWQEMDAWIDEIKRMNDEVKAMRADFMQVWKQGDRVPPSIVQAEAKLNLLIRRVKLAKNFFWEAVKWELSLEALAGLKSQSHTLCVRHGWKIVKAPLEEGGAVCGGFHMIEIPLPPELAELLKAGIGGIREEAPASTATTA